MDIDLVYIKARSLTIAKNRKKKEKIRTKSMYTQVEGLTPSPPLKIDAPIQEIVPRNKVQHQKLSLISVFQV